MNPPGTKPSPSARFPWSKGVMRFSMPGTLQPGAARDSHGAFTRKLSLLKIDRCKRMNTGIALCSDASNRGDSGGVWVGHWAGPVLLERLPSLGAGVLAGLIALLLSAAPASADWGMERGALLTDGLPRYAEPLRKPAEDLLLSKSNERIAEALAAFAEGLAAEENADYERAMDAYQRALSLDASNTELAVKVAFVLVRQGKIPQGIDILKDAEQAAPKDLLPALCLSQVYEKFLKKPQLAERYAQKANRLDPRNIGPYLALYEIYMNSSQPKRAEAILKKAMEAPTEETSFWLQLAEVRIQHESETGPTFPKEAVAVVRPLLEKALKGQEKNADALAKVADAYVLMWQIDDAAPLYRKVVELSADPNSDEVLKVRDKLARCLLAGENAAEGVSTLRAMISDAPHRLETYELLAEWYALQQQLPAALAIYQQALAVEGVQPKVHLRVAQLQFEQRRFEDAVATLTHARKLFPRSAEVTYALAQALSGQEKYREALPMFEEALTESRSSNEEVVSSEFYFEYGMAAERSGDLEQAAAHFRRCIEMDPENAGPAYNYLGYMWADGGVHLEEALELIRQALKKEPENAAYLDSLGWTYYRMGKYPQAVEALRKALERMTPEEAVLYDHLGDALKALGQLEEAIANWKKALELEPENEGVRKKLSEATKVDAGEGEAAVKPVSTAGE